MFLEATREIHAVVHENGMQGVEFDKDDDIAMRWVASASNLRARNFHLPTQTLFEIKGLAGNIIPAISTTNAIIAAVQVLEAIKVLTATWKEKGRYVCCERIPVGNARRSKMRLLDAQQLSKPKPGCFVCGRGYVEVRLDTEKVTLEKFAAEVLKKKMSFNFFTVIANDSILYEEGEDMESQLRKTLKQLGISSGTTVLVEDDSQGIESSLIITHVPAPTGDDETREPIEIRGLDNAHALLHKKPAESDTGTSSAAAGLPGNNNDADHDDDDFLIIDSAASRKRLTTDQDADDDLIIVEEAGPSAKASRSK
jgi:ubiquitin-like 1-activating enzyme E1 B